MGNNVGNMATLVMLLPEAETEREREFVAVVKVQSWFRAQRVRTYLQHLNNCAVKVQKRWRGFVGRKKYREKLKEHVFEMKLKHYNEMTLLIQKHWRGFYTRKYIFNYYSRKRYLEGLKIKNEIIRADLEEHVEQQELRRQTIQEIEERKKLQIWASKNHHMVSTEVQAGVYNSPYLPYPDEKEYHLSNAKPLPEEPVKHKKKFDPSWKTYAGPLRAPLPPVHQKPQGPFRDPREVQKQRYKLFQPSLRVETSFTSLEQARANLKDKEWLTRINDDIFQPFTRTQHSYDPLMHSSSKFGSIPYGTQHFREEYVEKFIVPKNFKTVVPPIPIFEKFNDTYSQGQVC